MHNARAAPRNAAPSARRDAEGLPAFEKSETNMSVLQERTLGLDRSALDARNVNFDSIPVIDIAALGSADRAEREQVAARIGDACERVGFFYVRNHGVAEADLAATYAAAEAFFSLPLEEKLRYDIHRLQRHRGYVPIGGLNADPHHVGAYDFQEAFEVSLEVPEDDPDYRAGNIMYGPNVWPERPAEFAEVVYRYFEAVRQLGRRLFRGFALALDMPEDFFEDKIDKPMAQLRVLYYPPHEGEVDPRRIGVGAHTDYECFTILAQSAPGLQVQNSAGEWIAAPPIPGTFVINIGDNMSRWTNGRFASTVHRVINATGDKRFSLPFFFGANYDAVVECLPTCTGPDNPPRHPPMLAGEWTVSNITAAYSYREHLR